LETTLNPSLSSLWLAF